MENKAQYCSLRIILDETVILEENKEYFVRGAVDCDDFNVETGIFVGYKDKLATIDVVAANAVVSVDSNGKIPVRLYNLSNNEIKMYKGTKLGSVEIFQEEDGYFRSITTSKNNNNAHVNDLPNRINDARDVPKNHKDEVKELILDYSYIFSKSETDIGCCKKLKHQIVTEERFPIAVPVRRISVGLEEKVD